jgi:predicted phage terminase large subunit-like protein
VSSMRDDLIACDRETAAKGSLKDFVKMAWPQVYPSSPFVDNWHIGLICDHYETCFQGEIRELVCNVPPGQSKSSITSVMFPAWGWTRRPDMSWGFAAYGQMVVRRDAGAWKGFVQSRWYQERWGNKFQIPTVPAIDLIKNDKGGFRLGTTPGGEVTGFHFNLVVIDDPNKPEELTKVGLQNTQDWMSRTMGSRWRPPPAVNSLILIMQRLHCDDLSQLLIDRGAVHLCLPANFDPDRRTVTTWGKDPRIERGELLDPVRLPQSRLDKLRRDLGGMNFAAQYDQAPVPEGGAVFKRDHLRFWSTNLATVLSGVKFPDGRIFPCVEKPPQIDQVVDSWDCAFKDLETADFVAGQEWGRVGSCFYLFWQTHGHLDFAATCHAVLKLALRSPGATILVEDKANGSAVVETLTKRVPGVVSVDPRGGKLSRASASSGLFEAGNVYLPDPHMSGFEWVESLFLPEMMSFPRAKKDDQIDAMTQGLLYMQENTSWLKAAMAEVRKTLGYVDTY